MQLMVKGKTFERIFSRTTLSGLTIREIKTHRRFCIVGATGLGLLGLIASRQPNAVDVWLPLWAALCNWVFIVFPVRWAMAARLNSKAAEQRDHMPDG